MTRRTTSLAAALGCGAMLVSVGCASNPTTPAEDQLAAAERELATLRNEVNNRERELSRTRTEVQNLEMQLKDSASASSGLAGRGSLGGVTSGGELLPPAAKAGECYARVFVPPTYNTTQETMLKKAAGERIEIIPAKYEMGTERVLVKEETTRLEVIPAKYETVTERVLVKEASSRIEQIPPVYETVSEKVLVRPARTVWKKGRGPIERVDSATGEIMCLVEEPAVYKTVSSRVIKTPASTRTVNIPAEYKTVTKRVVSKPATTREVVVPAAFKTVKVRRMAKPPTERRIAIPAEYQTVSKRVMVSDGKMAWRPILCETNADRNTVAQIQRALKAAGHNPGPIDGVIGSQTLAAVKSYQKKKGLPSGQLTYATLDSLGVRVGR